MSVDFVGRLLFKATRRGKKNEIDIYFADAAVVLTVPSANFNIWIIWTSKCNEIVDTRKCCLVWFCWTLDMLMQCILLLATTCFNWQVMKPLKSGQDKAQPPKSDARRKTNASHLWFYNCHCNTTLFCNVSNVLMDWISALGFVMYEWFNPHSEATLLKHV